MKLFRRQESWIVSAFVVEDIAAAATGAGGGHAEPVHPHEWIAFAQD
jgi:hypothetical protein